MKMNGDIYRGAWFEEARYGLFIHWGLYSIPASGEWLMHRNTMSHEEYNNLANEFNPPAEFSPEEWVLLAKEAGMRYAVFTTRHHDGFALFDSQLSDFNSVKTASRRDFVQEFVDACRTHDMRIGLYYSIMDWQFPACHKGPLNDPDGWWEMVDRTHGQLREIMSNYGKIDLLWYDGCVTPGIGDPINNQKYWRTPEMNAMVRSLQPDILVNNRAALPEDFATPEQHFAPPEPGRRCEACMTINNNWGYHKDDHSFKSVEELKRTLVRCASYNSNLLLNIGPRADGSVTPEVAQRLKELGQWLDVNGEAIYGTERSAYSEELHLLGPATTKANTVYFYPFDYRGGDVAIAGLDGSAVQASIVGGEEIPAQYSDGICTLSGLDDVQDKVIKLTFTDGEIPNNPPSILGGDVPVTEYTSDAPVLGENPDKYLPDDAPFLPAKVLQSNLSPGCTVQATPSIEWCKGWHGVDVLSSSANSFDFTFTIPANGSYDLEFGITALASTEIELWINGEKLAANTTRYRDVPDTLTYTNIELEEGKQSIALRSHKRFGVYGVRINPIWQPQPSELWDVIGPFPSNYAVQMPLSTVKENMETAFPPQEEFDTSKHYQGDQDEVIWTWTEARIGDHTDCGVNFPFRCGEKGNGLSYARTIIESPADMNIQMILGTDWWANVYLNGTLVKTGRDTTEDGAYFSTWKPQPAILALKAGNNELLVKCHPGRTMHWFTCHITNPGTLKIQSELSKQGALCYA